MFVSSLLDKLSSALVGNYHVTGQQSIIPSYFEYLPPSPFNGTDGSPSNFGSTCVLSYWGLIACTNNTDNPLFDCSASNNSYYGWDINYQSRTSFALGGHFSNHFQSMNILMTFLISTSSNVSAPSSIQCEGEESYSTDYPPANLPEGPYQHSCTLSFQQHENLNEMENEVLIIIIPNTTFQWVAINRIIFCAAATEGL